MLTISIGRLLSNSINKYILNPSYIPKVLKIARAALFPNNAPGPARKVPDAVEIILIKRRCAETVASILPEGLGARYFGVSRAFRDRVFASPPGSLEASGEIGVGPMTTKEAIVGEVEHLLGVLGDVYLNKHLIFGILSLVVLRLAPELGSKGVGEMMRERVPDVEDY